MYQDNFSAELITTAQANTHFNNSQDGTLYHNPEFIKEILTDFEWLGGFKKKSLLCTMPIFNNLYPEFFYYSGPLWSNIFMGLKPYRKYSTSQKIYEKMLEYLIGIRKNIVVQFPSTNYDIRAFEWWNYGKKEDIRFRTSIMYTAKITSLQSKTPAQLEANLRSDDKRKRLRRVLNRQSDFEIDNLISLDEFINLYRQTMSRGGTNPSDESIIILKNLFNYVDQKQKGFTLSVRSSLNKELVGCQLVIYQDKIANAVAQGIDQRFYSSEIVTYLIFNSILKAKDDGIETFDFNGANSPKRADDKHAYGADEVPFYSLTYGCRN